MKTQNKIRAAGLLLLAFAFQFSFANIIGGSIMGQVTDPETKEPVSDATVVLENQGTQKTFFTNEYGYYYASNVPAGVYSVSVSYMSNTAKVVGVKLGNDETKTVDVQFSKSVQLMEIPITDYHIALIDPFDIVNGMLDRATIKNMPIQRVRDIAETQPATVKMNGEYYVRGARAGGLAYYIDGCRVMGNPDIPLCGLDTYRMHSGFIPPKYGDALGGVVVMETRNYFGER